MRIITGRHKGTQLRTPSGLDVRPTMDRVREALFSILHNSVQDCEVLDLYAGTGSLGLEAVSRGAASACFVERNPAVVQVLKSNILTAGAQDCVVIGAPVERVLKSLTRQGRRFDLVFLDPPYRKGLVEKTIQQLAATGLVAPNGRIVCEHESRLMPPTEIEPFFRVDNRKYGDTAISVYSPMHGEGL